MGTGRGEMADFEDVLGVVNFVTLNTVPTKILCFGIDCKPGEKFDTRKCILMISGNPGEIEYYRNYLNLVHHQSKLPVVGVSNSGHNRLPNSLSFPSIKANPKCYDLDAQIRHKHQFIEDYFDEGCELFLLGHSIGGYMCLELMDRFPSIGSRVQHSVLVMPSLERMVDTEMGQKIDHLFKTYSRPLVLLAHGLKLLPEFIKRWLVTLVMKNDSKHFKNTPKATLPECVVDSATNLLNPDCLEALILMTLSEFQEVRQPNCAAMERQHSKLTILYGEADHWAPVQYFHELKTVISDKVDARLCLGDIDHAFVIDRAGTSRIAELTVDILSHKL